MKLTSFIQQPFCKRIAKVTLKLITNHNGDFVPKQGHCNFVPLHKCYGNFTPKKKCQYCVGQCTICPRLSNTCSMMMLVAVLQQASNAIPAFAIQHLFGPCEESSGMPFRLLLSEWSGCKQTAAMNTSDAF